MPPPPLLLLVLAAGALAPPAADGAPLTLYGVQLPDPLYVYALQEAKPENIRNDPFLVIFKTHVPSLRPYEIPYFPPKDFLSAEEQPDPAPDPAATAATATASPAAEDEPTTASAPPANDAGPPGRPEVDLERLPELVELKPEALLEALDASKQDLEEQQTTRPLRPAAPNAPGDSDAPGHPDARGPPGAPPADAPADA